MPRQQAPAIDWVAVQHEIFSAAAVTDQPIDADPSPYDRHARASASGVPHDQRTRSLSLSLPWHRPRSSIFSHDGLAMAHEAVVDDAPDSHHGPERRHGAAGSIKGIFRRASHSIRGAVRRRPSIFNEDTIHEQNMADSRPSTAHSAWNKLVHATGFRHSKSFYHANHADGSRRRASHANVPIPALGDEPPFIPEHTGAAAKASAAMQNEYMARQGLQNRWLHKTTSEDNDRESGIGIVLTGASADFDIDSAIAAKEADISKIDFITQLPTELAIHILAKLDAAALAKISTVSKSWAKVIRNQHVWRESYLREMSHTYATSHPVKPDTGLGMPSMVPNNDWKRVYQIKRELNKRWKEGKARPVYLSGHKDSVYCLQFDEKKIISGSRDKTIRVWDMQTLECRLIIGPPEVVNYDELLVDDQGNASHYATDSDNGKLATSKPKIVTFPQHHNASILCLQYDDEILVTGSSDGSAIIYDIKDGYRPIRRLGGHSAAVLDLVFDKRHIVTCSKDVSICVWDRKTGALVRQLRGHAGPVNAVQMRGNTIVSCSGDFRVKLWNIDTGKNIREFTGHTKGLACSQFSEDGRYVASAGNDKVIRIWDANTGECVHEMRAHENLVRSLHIDSVSGRLISGSYDTDIKVWDMETGHQLLDFPSWHASWVLSAKSDYRRIVSSGQDPKILIMDFGADIEGIDMLQSSAGRRLPSTHA
ncbi:hypothetical protein K4F52_002893 [Lecanicillium sp. MT-2017a]|nr:hypothetical protein K4F52_002893 [Lecanicillium sp. MT-2017a]